MPPTWNSLISFLSEITRENRSSIIQCSHCGNRNCFTKWGHYSRYLFNDEMINIQRYRCDNDLCPRKTFSILPHAFLPIERASVCMLMYVLTLYEQGNSIAQIARNTTNTWSRIQRWIPKALSLRDWLKKEYGQTCFSFYRAANWFSLTRDFSWTFYPDRFR
jgi:transposase-like protein